MKDKEKCLDDHYRNALQPGLKMLVEGGRTGSKVPRSTLSIYMRVLRNCPESCEVLPKLQISQKMTHNECVCMRGKSKKGCACRRNARLGSLIYEPCLARTRVYRDHSLVSSTGACMHSLKLNVGQTPKFTNPAHILEVCVSCATEDSYDQVASSLNTGFLWMGIFTPYVSGTAT